MSVTISVEEVDLVLYIALGDTLVMRIPQATGDHLRLAALDLLMYRIAEMCASQTVDEKQGQLDELNSRVFAIDEERRAAVKQGMDMFERQDELIPTIRHEEIAQGLRIITGTWPAERKHD